MPDTYGPVEHRPREKYLAALEAGATGNALAGFFSTDVVQEEFPNSWYLPVLGAIWRLCSMAPRRVSGSCERSDIKY
jgi:hypothetical protein